jgi:hypothetical protein
MGIGRVHEAHRIAKKKKRKEGEENATYPC